jgi:hypothetical protein
MDTAVGHLWIAFLQDLEPSSSRYAVGSSSFKLADRHRWHDRDRRHRGTP